MRNFWAQSESVARRAERRAVLLFLFNSFVLEICLILCFSFALKSIKTSLTARADWCSAYNETFIKKKKRGRKKDRKENEVYGWFRKGPEMRGGRV